MKFSEVIFLLVFCLLTCKINGYFNNIIVPAFSNFAELGEIYNARTNSFSRINLLNSGVIHRFVQINDTPQTKSQFDSSSTTSEKLKLFDFDTEIKLKILAKILNIGGAQGRYIKNSMENSNSAEYSYNLQIKTKTERLKWDDIELQKYYDLSEIKNHGTHLIVGIQYGGNAFVTISQKLNRSSSSRKAEVQNKLGINLINFLNVGTYSDTKFPYNETMKDMDFDISVEADVSPEEGDNLITLEGAVKYVNSLNGRLSKYNNGKGVILQYEMIPLHYINSISKPYTTLSNDVIFSVNEKLFYLEAINKKVYEFIHELEENVIYFSDEQYLEWNKHKLRFESKISSLFEKLNNMISLCHTNKSEAIKHLDNINVSIANLKKEVHQYNKDCENLLMKMDFIKMTEQNNFLYIFQERQFEAFKMAHPTSVFYFFTNKNYRIYRKLFLNYLKNTILNRSPIYTCAIVNADKLGISIKNKTFEETQEYPLYFFNEHNFHRIVQTQTDFITLPSSTNATIGIARTNAKCIAFNCPTKLHTIIPENTTIPTTKNFSHWFNVYAIKPNTKIDIYYENYGQTILEIDVEVIVRGRKELFEITMEINGDAVLLVYIKNSQNQPLLKEIIEYPFLANKKFIKFKADALNYIL